MRKSLMEEPEHILIAALQTTTPPYGVFCLNILLLLQSFQQGTGLNSWYHSLDIVETEKRIGLDGSLPSQLKYRSTGARFYQRIAACKEEPHTQLPHSYGGSFPFVLAKPWMANVKPQFLRVFFFFYSRSHWIIN